MIVNYLEVVIADVKLTKKCPNHCNDLGIKKAHELFSEHYSFCPYCATKLINIKEEKENKFHHTYEEILNAIEEENEDFVEEWEPTEEQLKEIINRIRDIEYGVNHMRHVNGGDVKVEFNTDEPVTCRGTHFAPSKVVLLFQGEQRSETFNDCEYEIKPILESLLKKKEQT